MLSLLLQTLLVPDLHVALLASLVVGQSLLLSLHAWLLYMRGCTAGVQTLAAKQSSTCRLFGMQPVVTARNACSVIVAARVAAHSCLPIANGLQCTVAACIVSDVA